MKLAYLIATRESPRRAGACIEVARSLASGKHEVQFILGVDRDDKETIKYFWDFYPDFREPSVIINIADRSPTLGSIWNRLAVCTDADVFCVMGDDMFVSVAGWDEIIAKYCPADSTTVIGWNDSASPMQLTNPIITRGWYTLNGLYTDLFPFWFDDTWIAEVWSFAVGNFAFIPQELRLTTKHSETKRLRDLKFWWTLFSSLRPERMEAAAQTRRANGMPPLDPAQLNLMRRRWELRDDEMMLIIPKLEAHFGADMKSPPTAEYLIALANAQELMRKRSTSRVAA